MASPSGLDDALQSIGKYGRYQMTVGLIITVVGTLFPAWHMMGIIFSADRPRSYHCLTTLTTTYPSSSSNISYVNDAEDAASEANWTSSADTECLRLSRVQVDGYSTKEFSVPCTRWQYDTRYNESTIVTDLDLVCDRSILAETAQSIFLFGMLVGSLVFGYVSDAFGRKIVILGACFFHGVLGIAAAFVWNYVGLVVLWFLAGMCAQGYNQGQFVMVMEMFPPECRTLAGSLNNMVWGLSIVTVSPIAYALRDWRLMQLAMSVPCLVALPLWPLLDESVRWLLARGRTDEAQKILGKMARWNGVAPPAGGFLLTREEADGSPQDEVGVVEVQEKKLTFFDVLKSHRVLLNMAIVFFFWFASIMTYYGASLNSAHLAGNKYANFLFLGLAELPGYVIIHFTMTCSGRRPSLSLFFMVAGLASITTGWTPVQTADGTDLSVVIIVSAMLVKLSIVCAYSINLICCTEILPTSVRNIGFGAGALIGNMGSVLAPFVMYLDDVASVLPMSIFGGLCIVSSLLVPLLPETRNKPLPETLWDAENIGSCSQVAKKRPTSEINANGYVLSATDEEERVQESCA